MKKINWFELCEGCGECCGPVPLTEGQFRAFKDKIQVYNYMITPTKLGLIAITKDSYCLFLNRITRRCMIYDQRPKVCRDYGKTEELPCYKIHGPDAVEAFFSGLGIELKAVYENMRERRLIRE